MFIRDAGGKEYLDACGGAAVSCLGHGHPDVLAAMHAQIDTLAYAHTSFFTTEPAEALADQLIRTAPAGMSHVYFVSGGSEAVEAALKMARQYFVEIGQPQRALFVARRQSYHGNTLGALAVGGNEWRRRAVRAAADRRRARLAVLPVPRPAPGETPEAYGRRLADELDATIRRLGTGQGDRVRRRDRRRRDRRRARAGARLLQGGARGLRPPRRAADPRRGDVRAWAAAARCTPASRKASCPT